MSTTTTTDTLRDQIRASLIRAYGWCAPRAHDRATDRVLDLVSPHLPRSWDDAGVRPVEGERGWVKAEEYPWPTRTVLVMWHPGMIDATRTRYPVFVDGEGFWYNAANIGEDSPCPWPEGALVRLPAPPACDHDHEPKWKAITDEQVGRLEVGTRMRVEGRRCTIEGDFVGTGSAGLVCLDGFFGTHGGTVYVRPEDVPADPDADLIEGMARAMVEDAHGDTAWDNARPATKAKHRGRARAALAVVKARGEGK